MKLAEAWQGKFDAFCGIYSAAHILAGHAIYARKSKFTYNDLAGRAFVKLIRGVEEAGLLTAKKIAIQRGSGFYDFELVDVFQRMSTKSRYGLTAIAFTDPWFKSLKNSTRRSLIDENRAYAIVRAHGKRHWVAVLGRKSNGKYIIFDPSLENIVSSRKALRYSRGVLIAPDDVIGSK